MVDTGVVILKRRGGDLAMGRRGTMMLVMIAKQRDWFERWGDDGGDERKKRRGVMTRICARCHPVSCIISLLDVFERKMHTGTKGMAGY
jgi:hypothetical protein